MSRLIQTFEPNALGRDLIVGDLHGCIEEFNKLLELCEFDPKRDRVFSVGDLVDRGPDSEACLALLKMPWFHSVIGNHELMMLMAQDSQQSKRHWDINGGGWWGATVPSERQDLLNAIVDLPSVIVIGTGKSRINILHAEFFGNDADLDNIDALAEENPGLIVRLHWGRDIIEGRARAPDGLSKTFVGHSILPNPAKNGCYRFIDTGAFMPYLLRKRGYLTLIDAHTEQAWHVGAEINEAVA